MAGHSVLLHLFGGVALLIWATRMVKTGILRAFGERLRGAIARATKGPVRACAAGIMVATALQSSTATGLLLVSFAERSLIALAPALAVMLGADIGSTIVVQVLSFNLQSAVPVLMIIGVGAFMISDTPIVKQLGRVAIGLALMILSLGLIVQASAPLRQSEVLAFILQRLGDDPLLAMLIAAVLTWLIHSSVAVILLFITLASSGLLSVPLAMALILGANVGSGLIPIGLSLRSGAAARRILFGNLAFRVIGALLVLAFVDQISAAMSALAADGVRQLANFHTAFNVVLALVFLPLTGLAARVLEKVVKEPQAQGGEVKLSHLDDALLERPQLALAGATREVMRLADMVEVMLRESLGTFEASDSRRRQEISRIDDQVDALQEAVKLYLTRLTRGTLTDDESRRCFDLILFTTNLEHAGDIIDKSLLELAAKKQKSRTSFSPEGWSEIVSFHRQVTDQMRRAINVFVNRDVELARQLIAEKDKLRDMEKRATENHLKRLREGTVASLETSALHLDILRDLKRINAHITSIAYPILEASGDLRASRLRSEAPGPAATASAG